MKTETPSDGARFEISWHQLLEIHKHWPMKLSQVNSPEQAEFVPLSGVFNEYVSMFPPAPPWTVSDSESDLTDDEESGSRGEPR